MKPLRTLRLERGLSFCNLGVLAGIHAVSLVGLESGKYDLHLSTLRKLAQALEVSVCDLIVQPLIGVIALFCRYAFFSQVIFVSPHGWLFPKSGGL